MTGGSFCECLGGYATCGLLRKNIPQSSNRSLTLDASVFYDTPARDSPGSLGVRPGRAQVAFQPPVTGGKKAISSLPPIGISLSPIS
jgi:hypothetical protein